MNITQIYEHEMEGGQRTQKEKSALTRGQCAGALDVGQAFGSQNQEDKFRSVSQFMTTQTEFGQSRKVRKGQGISEILEK